MQHGQFSPNPYANSPPFVPRNDSISPIQSSPNFYRSRGPYERRGNQWPGGANRSHYSTPGNNYNYRQRSPQTPYYTPNNSSPMSSSNSDYASFNSDGTGGPQRSPGQSPGWSQRGNSFSSSPGRFQHNPRKWGGNFGHQQRGDNHSFRGSHKFNSDNIRNYVSSSCCEDPWLALETTQANREEHQNKDS